MSKGSVKFGDARCKFMHMEGYRRSKAEVEAAHLERVKAGGRGKGIWRSRPFLGIAGTW